MTWERESLAWLAGLFEGEGCITTAGKSNGLYVLRLAMTDFDVVERAAAVVGVGRLYDAPPGKPGDKPQRLWVVSKSADVQAVLAAIWPWLGERRRQRAREALVGHATYKPRNLSAFKRAEIVRDWQESGDVPRVVAHRHGVSRSLVQMLIQPLRT